MRQLQAFIIYAVSNAHPVLYAYMLLVNTPIILKKNYKMNSILISYFIAVIFISNHFLQKQHFAFSFESSFKYQTAVVPN